MNITESFKIAIESIFAHKLRSLLTMIGIIIGVGSIIAIIAIAKGGEAMLKASFSGGDGKTFEVYFMPDEEFMMMQEPTKSTFTEEQMYEVGKIEGVNRIIPQSNSYENISNGEKAISAAITGITNDYFSLNPIKVKSGRMMTENEFFQSTNMLINKDLEKELFPEGSRLNEVIDIKGVPFKIIGIYEKEDSFFNFGQGEALIPLNQWPIVFGKSDINGLTIQVNTIDDMKPVGNQVVNVLNQSLDDKGEGKYEITNLEEIQKGISQVTNIMTMIIAGIAGISLLVGGIGVMNIMLVSVTERTREIGIRKALGATRGQILLQFLIEAMMLTLFGGLIGIGFGVGGAYIISYFAKWPPLISAEVVIGATLFSMILGIIFGLLPANKAAKLHPIDALRYE